MCGVCVVCGEGGGVIGGMELNTAGTTASILMSH